jgi:hypothetical protein
MVFCFVQNFFFGQYKLEFFFLVLVSFSGRVLVVQEVLRTVIIAPYRKAILVLCRFCRCVVGTRDPGKQIHIKPSHSSITFVSRAKKTLRKNLQEDN